MKNNTLKKILMITLSVAIIFAFTACGTSEDDAAAEVVTYKAITEPTFAPFDTTDEDGNIIGFDMDLLNAIGEDQGFKVEYTAMSFDSLIPAIEAGSADIIAAAVTINEARMKKVDFSDPYYLGDGGIILVVADDNNTVKSMDDLTNEMDLGAQTGTTAADEATKLADDGKVNKTVFLDGNDTLMLQLQNGDIDGVLIDKKAAEDYISKVGEGKVKTVGEPMDSENSGFAVAKGNTQLQEKINAGLKNLIENGKYAEICKKWGLEVTLS